MYDSDDEDDQVQICTCGWIGHRSQTADDSPPGKPPSFVCPLCGCDELRNYEITHDMDEHYVINPTF